MLGGLFQFKGTFKFAFAKHVLNQFVKTASRATVIRGFQHGCRKIRNRMSLLLLFQSELWVGLHFGSAVSYGVHHLGTNPILANELIYHLQLIRQRHSHSRAARKILCASNSLSVGNTPAALLLHTPINTVAHVNHVQVYVRTGPLFSARIYSGFYGKLI